MYRIAPFRRQGVYMFFNTLKPQRLFEVRRLFEARCLLKKFLVNNKIIFMSVVGQQKLRPN